MNHQNKQQMIDVLVKFSIESVLENRDCLEKIFADGISGFSRLNEAQLKQELRFRGLLDFDDAAERRDDDDAEVDDFDDEIERLVLWSGMVTFERLETTTD